MTEFQLQILELILKIGGAIGGLFLFFRGYLEYRKSNRTKRAEFLEKMITEFNTPDKKIALNLLDDYVYVKEEDRTIDPREQLAKAVPLAHYLRNHRQEPISGHDEVEVRRSFDHLLDFFTRLSYYIQNDLMTSRELIYFRYYIDKMQHKPEVRDYIRFYFYERDFLCLFEAAKEIH